MAASNCVRVGFLLNHDQAHQVAHAIPIAVSLARLRPDVTVLVVTTSELLSTEAERIIRRMGSPLRVTRLTPSGSGMTAAFRIFDRLVPANRLAVYGSNLDFFRTLDALVVTEKTSLVLKNRYGLTNLPLIHARHGAGDRAIGFNRQSASFDHVLVSGEKVRERLIAEAGVSPDRISMVGYPKFDLPRAPAPRLRFAHPDRPIVLYNPHPSPRLSSWYRHGRAVLDYFATSDHYNLIFAPHVMLFQRPFVVTLEPLAIARTGRIAPHVRAADNIHVDLGSPASVDMTYSDMAHLYLGDVSSQAYEFLRRPRPCVFLNSHRIFAKDDINYAMWRAGPVIEDSELLDAALREAKRGHPDVFRIQQRLLERTFSLTDQPSGDRAARAVMRFLEREPRSSARAGSSPAA